MSIFNSIDHLATFYRPFIGQSAYSPTSVSSNSIDILSTIYRTFRVAHDAKVGDTVTSRKYFDKGTA